MADAQTDPSAYFDRLMQAPPQASAPSDSGGSGGDPSAYFDKLMGGNDDAPAQGQRSGLVANAMAGVNSGIAHTFGAPVDLVTGALNLGSRAVKGATGYDLGQINHPAGGSQDFEDLFGLAGADPRNVAATTAPEQVARDVGEGVGSMVVPGVGAEAALGTDAARALSPAARTVLEGLSGGSTGSVAAKTGANAASGAMSGAGQYVGQTVGGPVGGVVGALAGGLAPGAGAAAYRTARGVSAEDEAARQFANSATDPQAAQQALAAHDPNVPGSQLTTAEITNDPGLLQMQNTARAKNQAPFQAQAQQNNAARVTAAKSVAPGNASPQATAEFFRNRLDQIDAAQQAVQDGAQAHADATLGNVGGLGLPEDYGATARQAIQQRYAGPIADSDQAEQLAQQSLAQGLGSMGGEPSTNPGAQQAQLGAGIRRFAQEGRDAANEETNGLWNTVRQNGDITFDPAPATDAVTTALSRVNATGGDVLRPEEQRLYGLIQGWDGPQDFDTIKSMRTNLGAEANKAGRESDRQAASRLQTVKSGLDASMDAAIGSRVQAENQAVAAGQIDPSQTASQSLLSDVNGWYARARPGQRPPAALAGLGAGSGDEGLSAGSVAVRGPSGTTGTPGGGPTAAPDVPGVAPEEGPSLAESYAAARESTRNFHQTYSDSTTGDVLQRGPYGGPPPMADADVPAAYWHSGKDAAADAQNFIDATNGRPEAVRQLQQYAAFDLRKNATNPDGSLNIPAWQRWMKTNNGPMSVFPEVRERFAAPPQAQQQLNTVRDLRGQLDQQLQSALGPSDATVMSRYVKPGDAGADGVADFTRQTGASPEAREAMAQYLGSNLRAFAAQSGALNPKLYATWASRYRATLNALPADIRGRFSDAAQAADTLQEATRARTQAVQDYQNSAARFWLKNDPSQAIAKAVSDKGTMLQNVRGMMDAVGSDSAAYEGLKRAMLDHIMGRSTSNVEAGDTGTNFLKSDVFQNALRPDGLRPVLNAVFAPNEMKTLDAIATDLQQANRSVGGSKAPAGPGTARDVSALGRFGEVGQSLLGRIASSAVRGVGMFVGHHLAGPEGLITGSAAGEVANDFLHASRAAKQERIADLITGAVLDPEQGRILLSRAQGQSTVPLLKRLTQRMGQVAGTYPLRNSQLVGATP